MGTYPNYYTNVLTFFFISFYTLFFMMFDTVILTYISNHFLIFLVVCLGCLTIAVAFMVSTIGGTLVQVNVMM